MDERQSNQHNATTRHGHKIWFLEPKRTPLDFRDVKNATQNICRYNGHIEWRLIRHLALCTLLATAEMNKQTYSVYYKTRSIAFCTAHDIHEIYVGDMVSGLKQFVPEFTKIEDQWEAWVYEQLGLDQPDIKTKSFIKSIDMKALTLEMIMSEFPLVAVQDVLKAYGRPTAEEFGIYLKVAGLTLDECWQIVKSALDTFNEENIYGKNRIREPDEDCRT